MKLSDDQINDLCEKQWKISNTWGLSYGDFLTCSFQRGADGKGMINGSEDRPGDTVYVHPIHGTELTRAMAQYWCADWRSYSHGFTNGMKVYRDLL
jgi:hypothetical protein